MKFSTAKRRVRSLTPEQEAYFEPPKVIPPVSEKMLIHTAGPVENGLQQCTSCTLGKASLFQNPDADVLRA